MGRTNWIVSAFSLVLCLVFLIEEGDSGWAGISASPRANGLDACVIAYSYHLKVMPLENSIRVSSEATHIPANILRGIVIYETFNRKSSVQVLEKRLYRLYCHHKWFEKIIGWDPSLGPTQLKISLRKRIERDHSRTIEALTSKHPDVFDDNPEAVSILITAIHLKEIEQSYKAREKDSTLSSQRAWIDIISAYNCGVEGLGTCSPRYGKQIIRISRFLGAGDSFANNVDNSMLESRSSTHNHETIGQPADN